MKMPGPLSGDPVAATGFDHTRKNSLGVPLRDIPTILREAIEWVRSEPF